MSRLSETLCRSRLRAAQGFVALAFCGLMPATGTLWAQATGSISATPAAMTFTYQVGAATLPTAQNLQVSGQPTTQDYTATVTGAPSNGAWLLLSSYNGKLPASLKVQVNPTGLSTGTYSATITLTGTGLTPPTRNVTVTLIVNTGAPTITASPSTVMFNYVTGTSFSSPSLTRSLIISSTGGAVSATLAVTGAPWLRASPTGAVNLAGLLNTITLTVDPRGLQPKTYSGTLKLSAPTASNKTLDIPVTLTVSAAPPLISATWPPGVVQGSTNSVFSLTGSQLFGTTNFAASGFSPAVKVTVTDSASGTVTGTLNIPVYASATPNQLRVNLGTPLIAGTVGTGYGQGLVAAGGTGPYTWSVVSGMLPPGLVMVANAIVGVPNSAGTYRFTLGVTDASLPLPLSAYLPVELTIDPVGATALRLTGPALPAGIVGTAYSSTTLTAAGGTGPYTWSATGLPVGLSLSSGGVLTGTPSTIGSTGAMSSTNISEGATLVTVPATFLVNEGLLRVAGTTPAPGGGISNDALIQVFGSAPQIASVVNSASYRQGTLSPGEIITIFGKNLGGPTPALFDANAPTIATTLPATGAATLVTINGTPAPLIYADSNQISCIVPYSITGVAAQVVATYNSVSSQPFTVAFGAVDPGIYTTSSTGQGQGAILNFNSATNDYTINSAANAAARGGVIVLYVTGAGAMTSSVDNQLIPASPAVTPVAAPTVTIGGQAGTVIGGAAPVGSVPGLLQLNVTVPASAPTGIAVPVVLTMAGVDSQPGVTVAIK
ncbi:MAG: hypothetical protein NTV70_02100 [Acidobacteria bacterium]|nr:hypothetical protein [Acidobacteriota bacterium]